jgi:cyanophycinase
MEGEEVFAGWGRKGLDHYARLGIPAEVLPVRGRADAMREDLVARLRGASVVFVSGGNPSYLARVLTGTPLWDTLRARLNDGLAYAGCSAGVACLNEITFDSDSTDIDAVFKPGLGLVPRTVFAPHWDIVDTWIPGATEFLVSSAPEGSTFIGMDEDTAMVGDGAAWEVLGKSGIHVRIDDAWTTYRDGERFDLALI